MTDNALAFKYKKMIFFFHKYHISLNNSTAYYIPRCNGLIESSNRGLVKIIKKLLEDNKRAWHTKLKYALWANRTSTKRAIGMVSNGVEVVFLASLGVPVMNLLHEQHDEPNHVQRRINQIIELNELRDRAYGKVQVHQKKMNNTFYRKVKEEQF